MAAVWHSELPPDSVCLLASAAMRSTMNWVAQMGGIYFPGGWRSKVKVSAGVVSAEAFATGWQPSSPHCYMVSPLTLSHKDTCHMD